MFLYIDPLKQGLKQKPTDYRCQYQNQFLYIDPLKQGLKLRIDREILGEEGVFIHRSIKTRIETSVLLFSFRKNFRVFIHRSIKTRIETLIL